MAVRNIIRIDEAKCNGCGNCITGCAEGALALVDGKARLVKESYCDGLGACLGECPTGALTIERREADAFDEAAVAAAMASHTAAKAAPAAPAAHHHGHGGGCPGMQQRRFDAAPPPAAARGTGPASQLTQWPIQLHLVSPYAPYYQGAHLLVAADCTAFALGAFHPELLAGRALAIACPKLDDDSGYVEKITALFAEARPASVTVARMEVPCCGGLVRMVLEGRARAGSELPVTEVVVGVEGGVLSQRVL